MTWWETPLRLTSCLARLSRVTPARIVLSLLVATFPLPLVIASISIPFRTYVCSRTCLFLLWDPSLREQVPLIIGRSTKDGIKIVVGRIWTSPLMATCLLNCTRRKQTQLLSLLSLLLSATRRCPACRPRWNKSFKRMTTRLAAEVLLSCVT